jgi:hypothetical protein
MKRISKGMTIASGQLTPESQLTSFIAKFDPDNQKLVRGARALMRKRYPAADEIVYDNYNFLVIGYGPADRPSHAIFSIAAAANGVTLFFLRGASIADPKKILRGSGNQVRSIKLPSVRLLDDPDVKALMAAAVAQAASPWRGTKKGELFIRSVSAKQRPRRRT